MDKAKRLQLARIEQLETDMTTNEEKAELIHANLEEVERAIVIIRSAIGSSVDWTELEQIVKEVWKWGSRGVRPSTF